jgi:hypothetical protein
VWVRKNTRKDITKLYRILADSGSTLTSSKYTKVQNELTQTRPNDTTEGVNLCGTGEQWWNTRYGCQPSSLYAKADYTIPTLGADYPKMITTSNGNFFSPSSIGGVLAFEPTGVAITQSGQYIQYYTSLMGNLAGKTMKIQATDGTVGGILISFGGSYRIRKALGTYQCTWVVNPSECNLNVSGNIISFTIPNTSSYFVVGNNPDVVGSTQPWQLPF